MRLAKLAFVAGCLLVLGCSGHTAVAKSKGKKRVAKETDVYLKAMGDELQRSIQKLKLANLEKPYFIEYFMWDIHSFEAEATFGALIRAEEKDDRPFRVDVRVGGYEEDNFGFLSQSSFQSLFKGLGQIMLSGEDYRALRHDLWLMTDAAYKESLGQLAGKRAYLQNKVQAEKVADFARAKPVVVVADPVVPKVDAEKWKGVVKRLSAVFRKYPAIQDSRVILRADFATRFLVNSEGSRLRQPESVVTLQARAATQADDGMPLKHYVAFYAPGLDGLPPEKDLEAAVRKLAEELTALREAKPLDSYTGPVLFAGSAAGDALHQVLAPKLLGHRAPLIGIPQMAQMAGQMEENRIDRRLLPRNFSVVDDPSLTRHGSLGLIGARKYDDEGVAAGKVVLVEKGKVSRLLASRTPMKDVPASSGHARRSVPGFNEAQITNLVVTAGKKARTDDQLKNKLLEMAREQDLDYAIVVKQLDDPDITGREFSMQALMAQAMGGGKEKVTSPILAYKVNLDGSEELVRGLMFEELSLSALKDIAAAGKAPAVYHKLVGGSIGKIPMPMFFPMMGGRGPKIPVAPVSVVAPSLLFEELELKKSDASTKKPVVLKHPYFDK